MSSVKPGCLQLIQAMDCLLNVKCSVLAGGKVEASVAVALVGMVFCMLMSGSYWAVSALPVLTGWVESWSCSQHLPDVVWFMTLL